MCVCGDAPSSPPDGWALIPARNEADHLAPLIVRLRALGFPVLVVDDGSDDGTAAVARSAGAEVVCVQGCGKGAAITAALRHLSQRTNLIVILDADGQHRPEDAVRLIHTLKRGYALVVGNRLRKPTNMPLVRRLTNRAMSALIRLVASKTVPDTQCGLKALNLTLLPPHSFRCKKFDWETEVLLQAIKRRLPVATLPVECIYRGTPSRIRVLPDTFRFFLLLFRYVLGARMGVPLLWSRNWAPAKGAMSAGGAL